MWKIETLGYRVEDLVLALPLRFPPLEMKLVVPKLQEAAHLVDMDPGDGFANVGGMRRVASKNKACRSAVHSAIRSAFLKYMGLLLVFILNSSRSMPYLSALDEGTGAGASSWSSSGAAAASHS